MKEDVLKKAWEETLALWKYLAEEPDEMVENNSALYRYALLPVGI
ncbi:MAG: hypothetical protein DDT23_00985 [candidate division WS2 bacterium]|nr:hypothetical protein [Candidatus Lithacetigena glycinireducens]